ncbi:MAG: MerR family transcriptional regulator [Desulfobacterales bacterium]
MKISELVKRTGVPKETIHYYIREGLLRKPRKNGINVANYTENYIDQIRLIKGLRDNYYLPLSVIKKILQRIKKQSRTRQSALQLLSEYFRPIDQFVTNEITGKEAFLEATGMGSKWLDKMEEWGILRAEKKNGRLSYSVEDVIIGKLLVDMDKIGFGPKDGYNPIVLKQISDFFTEFVSEGSREYYQENMERLSSDDLLEKGARYTEIVGLFLYYLYRKLARENFLSFYKSIGKTETK